MTDSKTEKKLIPMYTWLCAASGGTLICFIIAVARRRWKRTTTERVVMDYHMASLSAAKIMEALLMNPLSKYSLCFKPYQITVLFLVDLR